jgi:peroxiredoxin
MMAIDWQVAAAIATIVSTVAFIASAVVVVLQLRQAARERYFSITAHLFEIWQSADFQHDQLFLLHMLSCTTWGEFCSLGRGERAECAIHRVGGYYDRVGNLVLHGLIDKRDILPTIGGYAVAVWHRIEPLVKEMRLRENALLFQNYESLLPECHECYVPGIAPLTIQAGPGDRIAPVCAVEPALTRPSAAIPTPAHESGFGANSSAATIQPASPTSLSVNAVNGGDPQMASETRSNGGEQMAFNLSLPDTDGIAHALSEFTGSGVTVLVYARGAWCPFCLRQLADYAERYSDFKRSGVEVVAVSAESPRKARRMRVGLKLPFTVLTDINLHAANVFGLMGHEKPGIPTPATLVLDSHSGVRLSTLNKGGDCLFASDILEYARALKSTGGADSPATESIPIPQLNSPKPGILFARALANMAAGLISR